MKVDTSSIAFRYAFYMAYSCKCQYSDEVMKFSEMELDHIIPKYLKNKREELLQIIKNLNLPEEFDVESVYNILPVKTSLNRKKGKAQIGVISIYLSKAAEMASKVLENHKQFVDEKITLRTITKVVEQIENKAFSEEEVLNIITKETSHFEPDEKHKEGTYYGSYYKSTSRISLNGFLPNLLNDKTGGCCILFKSFQLRGLNMTLSYNDVLDLHNRKKINSERDIPINKEQFPKFENQYLFSYNNVSFLNTAEELEEFYEVIEAYAEKITASYEKINRVLGTHGFEHSEKSGGYRLGKISRRLWHMMLDFANEYDFDKGKSKWHIFDARGPMLMVSSNGNNSKYDPCFHARLIPEQVESEGLLDFGKYNSEIWLVWDNMSPRAINDELDAYSERRMWNASITYNWLTTEFIPYVVWYYEVRNGNAFAFWKKWVSFSSFLKHFKIERYIGM
jgi:hypothetical protein